MPMHTPRRLLSSSLIRASLRLSVTVTAALWLTACGLKDDYRLTLACKGANETLSKIAQNPAETASRDETRRYAFELRALEGYSCHTWRQEKIACIRSEDDEDTYIHESITIRRDSMTVQHVATVEKKKTGLVREESFQGSCTEE